MSDIQEKANNTIMFTATGQRAGCIINRAQRAFRAVKLLDDTVMEDSCPAYTYRNLQNDHTKSELEGKLWTWAVMKARRRSINFNTQVTVVQDADRDFVGARGLCACPSILL